MASFNSLMIEFLLGINLDEYKDEEDLKYILSQIGIDIEYIDILASKSLDYEQANDFIDGLHHIERL